MEYGRGCRKTARSAGRRQVSLLEGVRDRWRTSGVRGIQQGLPKDSRICWKAAGVAARRCEGPLEDIRGPWNTAGDAGSRQVPIEGGWGPKLTR